MMRHRKQVRGQALTEFLVVAVVLIPLFLLIPFIGKYFDLSNATQLASRYVAFDAMNRNDAMSTWKPTSQVEDEVRRRFFSNADAAIKTYDVAGDFLANQNLFWRDPQNKPLIERFSDVTVSYGGGAGTSPDAGFSGAADGDPFIALRGLMGVAPHGIFTADVSVKLANLPADLKLIAPFDQLNLVMQRSTSVVFDPWAATSAAQTESRAKGWAPIDDALGQEPFQTALGLGIQLVDFSLPHPSSPTLSGAVQPPQFGRLDKWRDVVPADRLQAQP